MKKKVCVILCSYNGERYINEQINSILNQVGVDVEIFARDDLSKDETINILREYQSKHTNFHLYEEHPSENIGVRNGFMQTLSWALEQSDEESYYAFADQDDVWLEDKLLQALNKMPSKQGDSGWLYYSNKIIVDQHLQVLRKEKYVPKNRFNEMYFASHAYGCTIVIDHTLAELCSKYVSESTHFHDDWIHRLAISIGSEITFDSNAYILYRQHGENTCGTFATDSKSIKHLVIRAMELLKDGQGYNRVGLASDIITNYHEYLSEKSLKQLVLIKNYKTNLLSKIKLILEARISGISMRNRAVWIIKVLLGYF